MKNNIKKQPEFSLFDEDEVQVSEEQDSLLGEEEEQVSEEEEDLFEEEEEQVSEEEEDLFGEEEVIANEPSSIELGTESNTATTPTNNKHIASSDNIKTFTKASFSQLLMEARAAKHLTIKELAEQTNIAPNIIEKLEKDAQELGLSPVYIKSHIEKLCKIYEVDHTQILNLYYETLDEDEIPQPGTATLNNNSGQQYNNLANKPDNFLNIPKQIIGTLIIIIFCLIIIGIALDQGRKFLAKGSTKPITTVSDKMQNVDLEKLALPHSLPMKSLPIPKE